MGVAPAGESVIQVGDLNQAKSYDKIDSAAWQQNYDLKLSYNVASPCKSDNTDVKGIQLIIKNLQNAITTVKRFSNINSAVDALVNENVEPGKTIKKIVGYATSDIGGFIKNIIGRIRGWVLLKVQEGAQKVVPFLFPSEVPEFNKKLNNGINGLSCAFAKIIRNLSKIIGNLLLQLIDKYINGPLCFVEDFISGLISKILTPIQNAISFINNILGSAVKGIENIANSLFNILDLANGISNFFKCDDDKSCPIVDQITRGNNGTDYNSISKVAYSSPSLV